MNWAFAIHGTPGKSESWGISNDDSYLKSFYDQANNAPESTKLDIDIRIVENVVCTYYNYLKLSNISNGIGRSGGYFGMSIRLAGGYCSDVTGMYKLLDQLYEQVVCQKILRRNGPNAEYCFSSFKDCSLELENIASVAKKALEQFTNDIRPFPLNFSPKHSGNISRYNIDDTGSNSFRDVLFRDAEVYVSTEYPLLSLKMVALDNDNKTKSAQIMEQQGVINRQSGEISSLNATVTTQNGTIQSQQKTINRQTSEIGEKGKQIDLLNKQLVEANNTIQKLSADIKDLQKRLGDAMDDKDSKKISDCITLLTSILKNKQEGLKVINTIRTEQTQKLKELDSFKKQLSDIQKVYNKATGTSETKTKGESECEEDQNLFSFKWKGIASKLCIKGIASILCIVSVLVLLIYSVFGGNDSNEDNFSDGKYAKEFVGFKEYVDGHFKQIDQKLAKLTQQKSMQPTGQNTDATQQTDTITRINLREGSSVQVGDKYEYNLEAYAGDTKKDCGGEFICSENVEILKKSGLQCKIRVSSYGSDSTITVRYVMNGETKKKRIIKVTK